MPVECSCRAHVSGVCESGGRSVTTLTFLELGMSRTTLELLLLPTVVDVSQHRAIWGSFKPGFKIDTLIDVVVSDRHLGIK